MYIKKVKKSNRNSSKVYEYLHLVENVRTDKGPRQKLILNLGRLDINADQYNELSNCIECLLAGQKELFNSNNQIERYALNAVKKIRTKKEKEELSIANNNIDSVQPKYQKIDTESIEAGEVRSIGPEYVCHSMWKELGFDEILLANGIASHLLQLIETLVVGRLVSPGSERHTWEWAENRSALYEMCGKPIRASLSSLYRAGDILFECKDSL